MSLFSFFRKIKKWRFYIGRMFLRAATKLDPENKIGHPEKKNPNHVHKTN